jgi:lysophospholipase L1-like esterase
MNSTIKTITPRFTVKSKLVIALLAALTSMPVLRAENPLKTGDKVAFLGDSITEAGYGSPGGYVQLVGAALAANGAKIEIIGAGISGHKSDNMLKRLERDVLKKKPQWMMLSCGVNDVWHGASGISLEEYKKNITQIVDQTQAAGIQVMILTSTMIGEDAANSNNKRLAAYNDFLRVLATEKKCKLADLNTDMQAALAEAKKTKPTAANKNHLTSDGVHMAPAGDRMMAIGVLKSLGLDATELSKAKDAWLDLPKTNKFEMTIALTQRQTEMLEKLAASRKMSVREMLNKQLDGDVLSLLKDAKAEDK